jgi:PAS domain S-box-containing protein
MRDRKVNIAGFVCVAQDIRGRYQNAQQLVENEARINSIINTTVDAIIMIDEGGFIITFNLAADKMFGYAASEVLGQKVNMLMPTIHAENHDGYFAHYRKTAMKKIIGKGRELTGKRKGGSTFLMFLSISEVSIASSTTFTGIIRDLSERDTKS